MNLQNVEHFLRLQPKVKSIYEEVALLSKKNPNDVVNKFKLSLINALLAQANEILGDAYKPFSEFDLFDKDELPTTSDVVFVLSPYLGALERLRCDNIEGEFNSWYWVIDGDEGHELATARPSTS